MTKLDYMHAELLNYLRRIISFMIEIFLLLIISYRGNLIMYYVIRYSAESQYFMPKTFKYMQQVN